MSPTPPIPAPAARTPYGLVPESADHPVARGRAVAHPRVVRRGRTIRLDVRGLAPLDIDGPVDLTIYAPRRRRTHGRQGAAYPPDPDSHTVVVEATLAVRGAAPRGARAGYSFVTDRLDVPGTYLAVFRRTDRSSRPVAWRSFEVRP